MSTQTCISCGLQTEGSIGAAGIHWSCLCQTCKDAEDAALARHLEQTKRILDIVREGFPTTREEMAAITGGAK